MNAKVDPSWKTQGDHLLISTVIGMSHLCIGCDRLNDGLRGARDVGEVELGAAALLHTAAHQQLVVAPVHRQHLQRIEHEVEKDNCEDKAVNEEKHLVEVVSADKRAVGMGVAGAAAGAALVRVKEGTRLHCLTWSESLSIVSV